jgi:hypothetical protein
MNLREPAASGTGVVTDEEVEHWFADQLAASLDGYYEDPDGTLDRFIVVKSMSTAEIRAATKLAADADFAAREHGYGLDR